MQPQTLKSAGEQKIVGEIENQLMNLREEIISFLREKTPGFLKMSDFYTDTCSRFSFEPYAGFTDFAKSLANLLQLEHDDNETVAESDEAPTIKEVKVNAGQFASPSEQTIAEYGVESMKRLGGGVIHVDRITENHNQNHPEHLLTKRQFANEMRKKSAKNRYFTPHGGNRFSLIEEVNKKEKDL